jgi:hypothetical protein
VGDIVNLRVVRKRARRGKASQQAAERRLLYGQSGEERALRELLEDKAQRDLDGNRIDKGDDK